MIRNNNLLSICALIVAMGCADTEPEEHFEEQEEHFGAIESTGPLFKVATIRTVLKCRGSSGGDRLNLRLDVMATMDGGDLEVASVEFPVSCPEGMEPEGFDGPDVDAEPGYEIHECYSRDDPPVTTCDNSLSKIDFENATISGIIEIESDIYILPVGQADPGHQQELTYLLDFDSTEVNDHQTRYELNEGSGSISLGWGNDYNEANLFGNTSWTTGHSGSGLSFDESGDYVVAEGTLRSDYTVSFWFNNPSTSGSAYEYMYSQGTVGQPDSLHVYFVESTGKMRLYLGNKYANISTNYDDGDWHLFTVAKDGTSARVFVDGNIATTMSNVEPFTRADEPIYLGGRSDLNSARFYGGSLDDVRIYDRALSDAEVGNLADN